jgi:hypothetical protein
MVRLIASAGVVGLVLLAAGAAVGQGARETSLPDAPSAVMAAQTERLSASRDEAGSPFGEMGAAARPMRHDEVVVFDGTAVRHKDPDAVFRKYLISPPVKKQAASAQVGVMDRATHAMARTVVTRNESGKGKLNTPYLLRTLAAVAKDSASTPYWRRHFTDSVGDFGSTVGSDAGMNLWDEFGPSIERVLKSHMPAFISRIGEHGGRG